MLYVGCCCVTGMGEEMDYYRYFSILSVLSAAKNVFQVKLIKT